MKYITLLIFLSILFNTCTTQSNARLRHLQAKEQQLEKRFWQIAYQLEHGVMTDQEEIALREQLHQVDQQIEKVVDEWEQLKYQN